MLKSRYLTYFNICVGIIGQGRILRLRPEKERQQKKKGSRKRKAAEKERNLKKKGTRKS
jgi:hypothetical protein